MGVTRPDRVDTVVVDYGGVLTNPLPETYAAFAAAVGLSLEAIGAAFAAATRRYGRNPMAALEVAEITEQELVERLRAELPDGTGDPLDGRSFGELWFRGRRPNQVLIDYLAQLRDQGCRLALLTNNVREWEPRWRVQFPVDRLFSVVVNSAHEGVRKPEPEIYQILLRRLDVQPEQCLFVDDSVENCETARMLGFRAVEFHHNSQAIAEISQALTEAGDGQPAPVADAKEM